MSAERARSTPLTFYKKRHSISLSSAPRGVLKNLTYMSAFIQYLKDTRGELKHVSWPTTRQTTVFTILVIVISIITAFYLGFFDYIFAELLDRLIF